MLQKLPYNEREEAANSISHEAYLRVQHPVYGIVGTITNLQEEIHRKQQELVRIEAEIAIYTAGNL
ncbi:hypothetical protein ZOSMA_3G01640 [Zostera marina]|uniref:LOB domain-containing protein n=1 Tax=Zostera marina TaxID=29655 RepID=A0A0K9P676_ZOSMR|nr:hypothetical protein ZOSMA_3G01640 [Zostera marina]